MKKTEQKFNDEKENGEQVCNHESGQRKQNFDADGCGYYTWVCDFCDFETFDQGE